MSGIYFHIPFCKQACYYCNFHFSTTLLNKEEMITALQQELIMQKDFFKEAHQVERKKEIVETIYLGGGTPSLLESADLEKILTTTRQYFQIANHPEITLEANPDDVTLSKLIQWKKSGINRLSLGVQSFFNEDLQWMNRSHDAERAFQSIVDIKDAGFSNFSVDLIFGIPGQSDFRWKRNIEQLIGLQVPHISCYALTVEPKTALDVFIKRKKYPPIDEEQSARQFEILMDGLEKAGYQQYEISNFAKPGFRSKHNSHYWQGIPYLGIGPSAHSFNGISRQWNIANNQVYIQNIQQGIIPAEKEILSPAMQWNEYIMTSLRTMEGCDLNYIFSKWGEAETKALKASVQEFIDQGQMVFLDNHLILTRHGKLFADGMAAGLFKDEL